MEGGGLDGYFGEQGLPAGIRSALKDFTDYLSRQFVPKWDSPNGEGEWATARTASPLVELVGVAAKPGGGCMCEGGRLGGFQVTRGSLAPCS